MIHIVEAYELDPLEYEWSHTDLYKILFVEKVRCASQRVLLSASRTNVLKFIHGGTYKFVNIDKICIRLRSRNSYSVTGVTAFWIAYRSPKWCIVFSKSVTIFRIDAPHQKLHLGLATFTQIISYHLQQRNFSKLTNLLVQAFSRHNDAFPSIFPNFRALNLYTFSQLIFLFYATLCLPALFFAKRTSFWEYATLAWTADWKLSEIGEEQHSRSLMGHRRHC